MTFGERIDRQLLTLTAFSQRTGAAGEDSSHSALLHHCLQLLQQRLKLSWESVESVSGGARRCGRLVPTLSLTLTQLAQLLAPLVVFSCECENKQFEMADSQQLNGSKAAASPTAMQRSSSTALPALPSPSSFSSASASPFLPQTSLVRNVSTVLMADKLVRSLSKPSSPLGHSPAALSTSASPSDSATLALVGFGPHRVPVGSFVRLSIDVRNNSAVLGSLTLQLHIVHDDGSDSALQQQHQQPVVLTAGSLSPLLPPIAAGESVRYEWSVCCLAKGHFAFRVSARTYTARPLQDAADGQERAALFARLHASLSKLRAEEGQTASQPNLSVRAPSEARHESDHSTISHFACPQLLLLDAYV